VRSTSPGGRREVRWTTAQGISDARREQHATQGREVLGQAGPSCPAGGTLGREHDRFLFIYRQFIHTIHKNKSSARFRGFGNPEVPWLLAVESTSGETRGASR
jgi:hypothetical protein